MSDPAQQPGPRLVEDELPNPVALDGGETAFRAIFRGIENASERIEMRAFLWHDDDTGNRIGRAILRAAERGVKVEIHKDRIAAVYEHSGGNKQSFFHKRIAPTERFQAWVLASAYNKQNGVKRARRRANRQRPNPLVADLLAHPNIRISHSKKRFDHSKMFVFDEKTILLGSMGIGDNHHNDWLDVMVQVDGAEHVQRLHDRMSGKAEFDRNRHVDFLLHNRHVHKARTCPMLSERLDLIELARESLVIEMAYLGDPRFSDALVDAVARGVEVTILTGARANVLGELNRATCAKLMKRTGSPDNLTLVMHPRMVHAKLVVVDGRYCDVGSANFTPLSHGVYDEINLYADDEQLARSLTELTYLHSAEAEVVGGPSAIVYKRWASNVERATVAFQSRKGPPRRIPVDRKP